VKKVAKAEAIKLAKDKAYDVEKAKQVFYKGENKCPSLYTNHANFHKPKGLNEIYKAVALKLGVSVTIRSASSFKSPHEAATEKTTSASASSPATASNHKSKSSAATINPAPASIPPYSALKGNYIFVFCILYVSSIPTIFFTNFNFFYSHF
jgi:hypothetical protein